jgi:hypothetical protein
MPPIDAPEKFSRIYVESLISAVDDMFGLGVAQS